VAALPLRHFRLAAESKTHGPETAEPQTCEPQSGAPQPLALTCGPDGPALAGAPLLRKTAAGFAPPPRDELAALTLAAYGEIPDLTRLARGLAATAAALNHGDLPLAMTAAVHLRLPDVTAEGAARLTPVADYLAKRAAAEPAKATLEKSASRPANGMV
jgi:hypothetical protein